MGLLCLSVFMGGCSVSVYRGLRSDRDQIASLASEVDRLRALRDQDQKQLTDAKNALDEKLRGEKGVNVSMNERGIVITFVSEVLFDSGKAELRTDAGSLLSKVGGIINEKASDRDIAIEGHTDNEPIQLSKWKSNWELSTARSLSVLKYLESRRVEPSRMRATGFGEYHPVASNDDSVGRQKNRRVEIIFLPKLTEKQRLMLSQSEQG